MGILILVFVRARRKECDNAKEPGLYEVIECRLYSPTLASALPRLFCHGACEPWVLTQH